jgi:hypothetical protein
LLDPELLFLSWIPPLILISPTISTSCVGVAVPTPISALLVITNGLAPFAFTILPEPD